MRGRLVKRVGAAMALAGLAAVAAPGCTRGPRSLNVLLVTLDTTRADHLRCYGNRRIETPHLDRLAREGIVFDDAISTAPLTLPAHSTIMTGLTPMAHGVRDNGNYRLGDGAETLAEILGTHEYDTAAVVGAFVLHSTFGLAQGFAHYDEDFSGGKLDDAFHYLERPADRVSDAAMRWLDGRRSKKPFFLWVHYFDAHAEYEPPSPYRERYAAMPYDGEIAYVDGQLGRLVDDLETRGLWKNTLVVVVGDHGESLGEHGESSHGTLAYDATLRVPFIVNHPDGRGEHPAPRWMPRRIPDEVQQIDILPTIAAVLEIPLPHLVEGESLLGLLDGKTMADRSAYAETLSPMLTYGWAPLRVVRTGTMKYIRAPVPELYDLEHDPQELRNLAPERPADVASLDKELVSLAARAAGCAVEAGGVDLSSEERAKLASLGYLQGGGAATDTRELDPRELERPDPKNLIGALHDYLQPGIAELDRGNFTDAESLVRSFLAADPNCGEGHFYLGLALRSAGRKDEALRELETAARLSPGDPKVPLHIGILQSLMGRPADARVSFEKSLALKPHALDPLFSLGYLDESEGRFDAALARYDRIIELDPGNASGHLSRGALLRKMGREADAAGELGRAAELVPHDARSLEQFGRKLGEMGHPELAQPLFEELARTRPDDAVVRVSLGNCYLLAGDHARAAVEYAAAVRLAPGEAQYQFLLGCAYGGLHEYDKARAAWEKTLQMNPAHAEARHNLELLNEGRAG